MEDIKPILQLLKFIDLKIIKFFQKWLLLAERTMFLNLLKSLFEH